MCGRYRSSEARYVEGLPPFAAATASLRPCGRYCLYGPEQNSQDWKGKGVARRSFFLAEAEQLEYASFDARREGQFGYSLLTRIE